MFLLITVLVTTANLKNSVEEINLNAIVVESLWMLKSGVSSKHFLIFSRFIYEDLSMMKTKKE